MYAPDNLCLFEFLSLALSLPEMPTSSGFISPQEKEHFIRIVQSTDKIYSPLLIFNCALIGSLQVTMCSVCTFL